MILHFMYMNKIDFFVLTQGVMGAKYFLWFDNMHLMAPAYASITSPSAAEGIGKIAIF